MPLYERVIRRRGSGDYQKGRAGENLGRGQVVYKNPNGAWYRADADAVATMPVIGITLDSAIARQVVRILTEGYIGSGTWAWTTGSEIYASTIAGALTQTAPIAPDIAQPIAMAVSPTMILFDPHLDSSAYENRHITEPDAEVYSTDGGTTFTYRRDNAGVWEEPGVTYVDPALAIEAALAWIDGQGGGVLRTRGPGEIWTCATQVNIPGANITWISDWSLTLTIPTTVPAFDDNVVEADQCDNLIFHGLHIDGNKAGQTTGVGAVSDGIRVSRSSHIKILYCWFESCARYGAQIGAFNTDDVDAEMAYNYCNANGWNGLTIGTAAANPSMSRIFIHHNYVVHSSDVGITPMVVTR